MSGITNEGVLYDREVTLNKGDALWRWVGFLCADGEEYEYLTNDLTLQPGVIFSYFGLGTHLHLDTRNIIEQNLCCV